MMERPACTDLHEETPPDASRRQPPGSLRARLNTALFDLHSPIGRRLNLLGMLVITATVVLSMAGTLSALTPRWRDAIHLVELLVSAAFALEYGARLYAARRRLEYATSFYGLVDLLSWLPLLLLGDVSVSIRLLRVLRLLKLLRYLRALRLFLASLRDVLDLVMVVVAAIAVIAVIAGNLIHLIEPQTFENAFVGSWWGVVTMTTVGYGDLVPVTALGKAAAAGLMFVGITMFALLTATVSAKVTQALGQRERCDACGARTCEEHRFCPGCGVARAGQADDPDTLAHEPLSH